ncbi:GNAT family N-acetyltransferase [Actinomycetospora sp. OC33-EN08]|uniref:GNAT family N-acetyltransferase n=1 Tax=Actinomycetospora aurantiaca TaxID=3129233 RepID=A0ABU8MPK4_9PSEU
MPTTTCPPRTDGVVALRALTPDDVGPLLAGEDDDLARWLTGAHASESGVRRWIDDGAATWAGDWYAPGAALSWGVCDAATGLLAGTVEVELSAAGLAAGEANLSYGVFGPWRGRRYAARAVGLVVAWLGGSTGASTAVIRVDPANVHSMQVPVDAGFARDGRARRAVRFVRPVGAVSPARPVLPPSAPGPRRAPGVPSRG